MFTDDSLPAVNIVTASQNKKEKRSLDVQTVNLTSVSCDAQTSETKHAQTQTAVPWKDESRVDYSRLAGFLRRVVPDILEALNEGHGRKSLDEYDSSPQARGPSRIDLKSFIRIGPFVDSEVQVSEEHKMKVSDLSWSANDETLAISYSAACHPSWCGHLSCIQLHRTRKIDGMDKTPWRTLETNGCVTSLSYHPLKPAVLVAGLFNGDVVAWDLSNDDTVSPLHVCTHEDSVSQVYWMSEKFLAGGGGGGGGGGSLMLMTSGKNGDMLIHRVAASLGAVELHRRLKVTGSYSARMASDGPQSAGSRKERVPPKPGVCVTCFDFSWEKPILLIVGTLCGRIYKCSLDRHSPSLRGGEDPTNPMMDEYEKQECNITCIKCSPSSDIFATSGSNKEIRVYNLGESAAVRSILVDDTVVGLTWITGYTFLGKCNLFAAYGAARDITFYDVRSGKPVTSVPIIEPADGRRVTCVRVNSKGDAFALGDTQGRFELWKMCIRH